MSTRVLLVGCNYPGTESALGGCVLDCLNMKELLVNTMGIPDENITVLVDDTVEGLEATEENCPTKGNTEATLSQLVSETADGDTLIFYFSGHGAQIPSDDGEEGDNHDEAICTTDNLVILDDDLRGILSNLPAGAKFMMISDSCHSGTLLDHTEVFIDGPKEDDPEMGTVPEEQSMLMASAAETGSAKCIDLLYFLQNQMGGPDGPPVHPGCIRFAMAATGGRNTSVKYMCIWDWLDEQGIDADNMDPLDLYQLLCEQCPPELIPAAGPRSDEGPVCCCTSLLISGCQSHEYSMDSPYGGRLTLALIDAVKTFKECNPDMDLSTRSLVYYIRDLLAQQGMDQNPCLEGTEEAADEPFFAFCSQCV